MEQKQDLRKLARNRRDALTQEERAEMSARIATRLFAHPLYENASAVCCYVSFRSEVSTTDILNRILHDKKTLFCPKVLDVTSSKMDFFEITSIDDDLVPGCMGIPEPRGTTQTFSGRLSQNKEPGHDLFVMPGLAFNHARDRIGYGGGFYDRYLRSLSQDVPTVALAFDVQVFDCAFPAEEYDRRPDVLITESRSLS